MSWLHGEKSTQNMRSTHFTYCRPYNVFQIFIWSVWYYFYLQLSWDSTFYWFQITISLYLQRLSIYISLRLQMQHLSDRWWNSSPFSNIHGSSCFHQFSLKVRFNTWYIDQCISWENVSYHYKYSVGARQPHTYNMFKSLRIFSTLCCC